MAALGEVPSQASQPDREDSVEPPSPSRVTVRHRGAFLEMLISSLLGLTASLVLSIDAVVLAADPNAALACNISSTISCAKVGVTWQANLLGFPNAFIGLIAEPSSSRSLWPLSVECVSRAGS